MTARAWTSEVDLAYADRTFGAAAVDRALADTQGYASPPRLDGAARLLASVTTDGFRDNVRVARAGEQRVAVRAGPGGSLEVSCTCTRQAARLCEHVVMLVVDLAVHDALREAVSRGDDAGDLVDDLPRRRRDALERRTLDERLARWAPPRFDDDLEIDVEPARTVGTVTASGDDRPVLLVRARRASSRGAVSPREIATARLTPRDRRVVELTAPSAHVRDALIATRALASMLIELLAEQRRARTDRFRAPLRFAAEEVAPRVFVEDERLVARWITANGDVVCDAGGALLFIGPFPWIWAEERATFFRVARAVDLDVAWGLSVVPSLPASAEVAARVGKRLLGSARGSGVKLPPPEAFGLPPLETPTFSLTLSGSPLDVRGELSAVYRAATVPLHPGADTTARAAEAASALDAVSRDDESEALAVELVTGAGFVVHEGRLFASEEGAVAFWREGAARLRASAAPRFELHATEALARARVVRPIEVSVSAQATSGWLDVDVDARSETTRVDIADLRAALAAGRRWITLDDGALSRIEDEVAELIRDIPSGAELSAHGVRLPKHQLGRVERWLERYGGDVADDDRARIRDLRPLHVHDEPELPRGLTAELRTYQRRGLAWLQFLRDLGAGGVLADDMGLGKTVTTLAFIASEKERAGDGASLVVCPTSVVGNWIAEAARFTPGLRVVAVRGARDVPQGSSGLASLASRHDLIVTTYALLRRLAEQLASVPFRVVALDEAQNIKNHASETSRAARLLRGEVRLALTGTPIENRLSELWSLLDFANPGMLGTVAELEERFAQPMALRPDAAASKHLRALVRPFVLRRTKAEVLGELPPKTEVDCLCVLGTRQRRRYVALTLAVREAVRRDIEARGLAQSQLSVLTALLRLRQMACDPRLVDPAAAPEESAKRARWLDLVRELVAEGRRALVFSQFVELLTLWREDLDREAIPYEYLDGRTQDRDAVVARFQGGHAPLMLVSLKAGGAGLNLTAADTVILCDPWWNPAVEDQAADRAHRPGQTRPVTVVRLVAEGTIEDKVRLLESRKRALAESVLGGEVSGEGALVGLSAEDVALLLDTGAAESAVDQNGSSKKRDGDGAEERPPGPLEIDELRAMVRWLDGVGVRHKELAKRVGTSREKLSLLLVGHRVRLSRVVADRVREVVREQRARLLYPDDPDDEPHAGADDEEETEPSGV